MINTATPAVTMSNGQSTTATPPGMNPPHGQPNHRCDIPVGAPLNSKPTQAANVQPMKINMPTTTMTAPNTVTPPGMNPPHGQPNHRCDIAVGAPLNSKPNTPAVTTQPVTSQPAVAQPVANPAAAAPIINDVQGAKQLPVAKKDSGQ
jgi:hypothetical protein